VFIGRFRVIGRIGRGGMGMVYRAVDDTLERELAVKTLNAEGSLDDESRRRFEIEAKAAAKLQHPNIVTVFELAQDRGIPYIAMELLPGTDLEALLRAGEALLLREKLEVVIQICRGLAYAHEHGIVHRDIKPSNIRLLDDGAVKIMDFGIAKLGGTNLTKSGMMVGTIHYMSPEQVRGKTLDGRSDVFSVGVILYELLAGHRPFRGEGATEILYKIVNDEPEVLAPAQLAGLPRLHEIVSRALAKDPDKRYPTAAALADDLAKVLETEPGAQVSLPADAIDVLSQSRKLVKEGRAEDGLAKLQALRETHASSVEVRRALRSAARELQRRKAPAQPETLHFPELEATFQASPTQKAGTAETPATLMQPTVAVSREEAMAGGTASALPAPVRPAAVAASKTPLLIGAGVAVAVVLGLVIFLSRGKAPAGGGAAKATAAASPRLVVRSQPSGAAVLVDGKDTGVVTDGEIALKEPLPAEVTLTFRKAGLREATRVVKLPLPAGEAISVTLAGAPATFAVKSEPAGASVAVDGQPVKGTTPLDVTLDGAAEHRITVSLEGHGPKDVLVAAGQAPGPISVKLEAAGPTGSVEVVSAYPVDVLFKGRTLVKGQAQAKVSLPAGRQTLTIVAPAQFMRADLTVTVPPGGGTLVETPGLGRLSIRALPDNCQVFIDGTFADYPPILDKAVAAGRRTVTFKWPDGATREEVVEVPRSGPAFVTGRKE
jgi:serine/threonine-protein kinase